ncbi:MAG: type II toxin-antitoxin system Phd/YefM family antitoxin [Solirubrobacterales bacterium]
MAERLIPQRQLRNEVGRVLREAEAGATFTITVRGRPVARLGPLREARVDVDRETLRTILAEPLDSEELAADLAEAERPLGDPRS